MAEEGSARKLALGETKTFTIYSYFPVLHPDTAQPTLSTEYEVAVNSWEELGVEVEVLSSWIEPSSAELWEVRKTGDWYLPSLTAEQLFCEKPRLELTSGSSQEPSQLLLSWTVPKYLELAELDDDEFAARVGALGVQDQKLTSYVVYEVTVEFSVTLPDDDEFAHGAAPFEARRSDIRIVAESVLADYGDCSAAVSLGKSPSWASIVLRQANTEEGVTLQPIKGWKIVEDE